MTSSVMPYYAVTYTYSSDSQKLDEHRPAHREFLKGLADQGICKASGPLIGDGPARALLIFSAGSDDAVRELLEEDPFQQLGLVTSAEVTEWNPVIGVFAG